MLKDILKNVKSVKEVGENTGANYYSAYEIDKESMDKILALNVKEDELIVSTGGYNRGPFLSEEELKIPLIYILTAFDDELNENEKIILSKAEKVKVKRTHDDLPLIG